MNDLPPYLKPRDLDNTEIPETPHGWASGTSPFAPKSPSLELGGIMEEINQELDDPLKLIARKIRPLSYEHMTKWCEEMGQPAMAKTLVLWAIAKLDGTEMPKPERRG